MTKLIKISYILGLGIIMFCLASCEEKQEARQIDQPPKVISKTIAIQPSAPGKKVPGKVSGPDKAVAAAQKDTGKIEDGLKSSASSSQPDKDDFLSQATAESANDKTSPVAEELVKREKALAKAAEDMVKEANQTKKYDSKGRVDPFIPLLSEKKEAESTADGDSGKPKRMLTPLEKMDLSQIKLVAVIQMTGRSLAMVEEANGKGYEVKLGTYMGQNGGQVSAINAESVVVKEYFKDFKGKRRERFQEIKFHNIEGGE